MTILSKKKFAVSTDTIYFIIVIKKKTKRRLSSAVVFPLKLTRSCCCCCCCGCRVDEVFAESFVVSRCDVFRFDLVCRPESSEISIEEGRDAVVESFTPIALK